MVFTLNSQSKGWWFKAQPVVIWCSVFQGEREREREGERERERERRREVFTRCVSSLQHILTRSRYADKVNMRTSSLWST